MIEWKPIEKAPKDGTVILVCNFEYKGKQFHKDTFERYVFAAEYSINGYWKIASSSGIRDEIPYTPTHYAKINE